ncbi:MAG: hypothetical protein JWQ53_2249 [Klenkia sp.]|nr:hypothetical protein [Klenkia sp.]
MTPVEALDALVAAFASSDEEAYFDRLHPDATFVLPGSPRFGSREEYRAAWRSWVAADGFRVLACTSTDQQLQWVGETALLTHHVRTTVATHQGEATTQERETVVLTRDGDRWLVVHEHLSPAEENA